MNPEEEPARPTESEAHDERAMQKRIEVGQEVGI